MCASFPSSGPEGGRPHFLLAGRAVPYYNGTKNTSVVSSSDRPLEGGLLLKEWKAKLHDLTAIVPRGVMNFLITAFFMAGAYYLSRLLFQFGVENNSALVYVLAVTFVSWLTTGYFYGILASLFSSFCINYYFMYPYSAFSLSYAGYPVAMLSMTAIAIIICTLTSRIKLQALEAEQREQNTKALYELNERLNQEKNAIQLEAARETIRSNILRSVSHDLRTPLTAISGAAAVLLSSEEPRCVKDVSLLNDIKNDAEALTTMVENLLSITRIQDASVPLKKREEMLEEVAGDAVLTTRRRFPDANVQLDLSEDILFLPMEPMLIKQVIVNLLENAVRHSGDTQHIQLHLFRQEEWAVVEVRDHVPIWCFWTWACPTWTDWTCSRNSADCPRRCLSSSFPPGIGSLRRSKPWTWGRMTMWSSPSVSRSCWPASEPPCAGPTGSTSARASRRTAIRSKT